MKRFLTLFSAALIFTFGASSAQAEFMTVSFDTPLSQSFSNSAITGGTPSGYMLGASFPGFPVAFGYESYATSVALPVTGADTATTSMINLNYLLPVPLVNITLGGGAGSMKFDGGAGSTLYGTGALVQYYIQLGWSFGIFDVHMSQRSITGTTTTAPIDIGSSVSTVGVMVGF